MKRHIQDHYVKTSYNKQTISRCDLRELIQEAWDLVRDEDIAVLYDSWRDRCDAVISANKGPPHTTDYLPIYLFIYLFIYVLTYVTIQFSSTSILYHTPPLSQF